jgi:hypothetical protein
MERSKSFRSNLRVNDIHFDAVSNSTNRGASVSAGVANLKALAAGGGWTRWTSISRDGVLSVTIHV